MRSGNTDVLKSGQKCQMARESGLRSGYCPRAHPTEAGHLRAKSTSSSRAAARSAKPLERFTLGARGHAILTWPANIRFLAKMQLRTYHTYALEWNEGPDQLGGRRRHLPNHQQGTMALGKSTRQSKRPFRPPLSPDHQRRGRWQVLPGNQTKLKPAS